MLQMLKHVTSYENSSIFYIFNLDFDQIVIVILSPQKVHGPLTIRMHYNWLLLNVQLIVNEAWLFTFCHWTHGCDVNVVNNYLNPTKLWSVWPVGQLQYILFCQVDHWICLG